MENKVGWKSMLVKQKLVRYQSWLKINVCWKQKLVGHQSWLEINGGWKPKLVGHLVERPHNGKRNKVIKLTIYQFRINILEYAFGKNFQ